MLFLLPCVSFWNSGGGHGILEGKEYIMFLMASNATELLLTVRLVTQERSGLKQGFVRWGGGQAGLSRKETFKSE